MTSIRISSLAGPPDGLHVRFCDWSYYFTQFGRGVQTGMACAAVWSRSGLDLVPNPADPAAGSGWIRPNVETTGLSNAHHVIHDIYTPVH